MEQHDLVFVDGKEGPSDPACQIGSEFPQVGIHLPREGHTYRPPKLQRFDVLTKGPTAGCIHSSEPISNGFSTRVQAEE